MNIDRWNDIFTLLAMVIIADKRVYKEEVDTFVASAMKIKAAVDDETLITPDLVFEWFRGHRAAILNDANTKQLHVKALSIIIAMKSFAHRKTVLRAMVAVSVADNEMHPTEESLLTIAAKHWGLNLSDVA